MVKNIFKSFSILLLSIVLITLCGCTSSLNFRHAYDKGMIAYDEKDYETAIMHFNNALNYKPDSYSALCLLATSYAYNKNEHMAERTFQDAIRLFPNEWNAYILYADLKRAQHDYPAAIDFYETAITLGSMGGKEKAYYKKLLKDIVVEEAEYDARMSFSDDVSKKSFKKSKLDSAKKRLLKKQDEAISVKQLGDVSLNIDMNVWRKVHDQKDGNNKIVQYALIGEDIVNYKWSKLIVVQYFAINDSFMPTLSEYFKGHISAVENLSKTSSKPFVKKIIEETSSEILYEWNFDNAKESEIARIVHTNKGLYHLHVAKKGLFTDAEKQKYTELLKTAVLK